MGVVEHCASDDHDDIVLGAHVDHLHLTANCHVPMVVAIDPPLVTIAAAEGGPNVRRPGSGYPVLGEDLPVVPGAVVEVEQAELCHGAGRDVELRPAVVHAIHH